MGRYERFSFFAATSLDACGSEKTLAAAWASAWFSKTFTTRMCFQIMVCFSLSTQFSIWRPIFIQV